MGFIDVVEGKLPLNPSVEDLRLYARTFPSQGGVEIGPWLEKYATSVPLGSAIVELGCWLGAGTAHLALGARKSGAEIHCFDRWHCNEGEARKAAERSSVRLETGQDTLSWVQERLAPFGIPFFFHQGEIRQAQWTGQPIGLYVDDATKVEAIWNYAMSVFKPSFIPGKTLLVLMDYHFGETAGPAYDAQKNYMAAHKREFELVEERMGGTSAAVFRYLR